jgi:SOS-response transcriptional repressor LexA
MAISWTPRPMKEHGHRTFAYQQPDDTMTAVAGPKSYPAGCLVYIDPDVTEVANDKPALVRLENGSVVMAYCMAQAGRVWLRLLNPAYPPIMSTFTVLGAVIGKWEEP